MLKNDNLLSLRKKHVIMLVFQIKNKTDNNISSFTISRYKIILGSQWFIKRDDVIMSASPDEKRDAIISALIKKEEEAEDITAMLYQDKERADVILATNKTQRDKM